MCYPSLFYNFMASIFVEYVTISGFLIIYRGLGLEARLLPQVGQASSNIDS